MFHAQSTSTVIYTENGQSNCILCIKCLWILNPITYTIVIGTLSTWDQDCLGAFHDKCNQSPQKHYFVALVARHARRHIPLWSSWRNSWNWKAELCGVCFPIIHLLFCLYRPLVRIFLWVSFNGGDQVHHCQAHTHNSDVIFCSAPSLRCWHGHGSCTRSCFPSKQEPVHEVSQAGWCADPQLGFHCQMTDRMFTEFIHWLFFSLKKNKIYNFLRKHAFVKKIQTVILLHTLKEDIQN